MPRAWNDIDWFQRRPSVAEVVASWSTLAWEARPLVEPALDRYLEALDAVYVNGGHLVGRWGLANDSDVARWFVSRNRLDEYELFRTLVVSPAFQRALPQLQVSDADGRFPLTLEEQWSGSLMLDGMWAGLLVSGGAYESFPGTARDAKRLAGDACTALITDRYEDFRVDVAHEAWAPWFTDVVWDATYVLTDMRSCEVTMLCVTDTD